MSGLDAFKEFNAPLLAKLKEDKNHLAYYQTIKNSLLNQEGPFAGFWSVHMNDKTSGQFLSNNEPHLFASNKESSMVISLGRVDDDNNCCVMSGNMFNGSLYPLNVYDIKNAEKYSFKYYSLLKENEHDIIKKMNVTERMNAEELFFLCDHRIENRKAYGLYNQ